MVKEAEKLIRQEERIKKREQFQANREAGDDGESIASSGPMSDKSASKKSHAKAAMQDGRSAQSPNAQSEKFTQSERQSLNKHQSQMDSVSDEDGDDGDDDGNEESMDDVAGLPSQNEMKEELKIAIEEELREQEALRKQNEELQRQIILMEPSYEQYDK